MKRIFLRAALIAGLAVVAVACGSNDDPTPEEQQPDAELDYKPSNASSWHNYMTQVAGLLRIDAQNLYDAWSRSYAETGGRPFAEAFKAHDAAPYTSAIACVDEIIDGCADIANEVGTAKIGDPYSLYTSGRTTEALYAVESWYSWHSRDDYTNNIYSIRNSYFGSLDGTVTKASLSAYVAATDAALDIRVKEAIAAAARAIQNIPQPFRNHINSAEAREAMNACSELEMVLSNELKPLVETHAADDAAFDAIVANYVDRVVLPTYSMLVEKNTNLCNRVAELTRNPTNAAFEAACEAWLEAREPWEKSEAFLFGPVDNLGLDPNMDSWPLDQEAIVQILNSGNYDDLDWTDGDDDDKIEKTQSVRGFHTLEFLLFKDGRARRVQ